MTKRPPPAPPGTPLPPSMRSPKLHRRTFLRASAAASAAVVGAGALTVGCDAPVPVDDVAAVDDAVRLGFYSAVDAEGAAVEPKDRAKEAFLAQDLSWLNRGDSVLLKVASNSGNRHPATTAPSSVQGVCEALFERGAGRVIVSDQAGVQQVRLVEDETRHSSTRAMFERNGILDAAEAAGAELHFYDDAGYAAGYFAGTPPDNTYWPRAPMLPNIVREVDHIVYLPRLSSHLLAGYTHGTKIGIGWLRDDSRHDLHHDAQFFYEKFVDVNYCTEIQERFRLAFTFVERLLLHQGPDFGTQHEPAQLIAVGARSLACHDAVTIPLLTFYDARVDGDYSGAPYGGWANLANYGFVSFVVENDTGLPWTSQAEGGYQGYSPHDYGDGIRFDRALSAAFAREGGKPASIGVTAISPTDNEAIRTHLRAYSDGLLTVPDNIVGGAPHTDEVAAG